jgi:hypothetical protein
MGKIEEEDMKKYKKPEIKKVKLVPEEAVLKTCKRIPNGSTVTKCNCGTSQSSYS